METPSSIVQLRDEQSFAHSLQMEEQIQDSPQIKEPSNFERFTNALRKCSPYFFGGIILLVMYYLLRISSMMDEELKCPLKSQAECMDKYWYKKKDDEPGYWLKMIVLNCMCLVFFIDCLLFGRTLRILPLLGLIQFYWLYLKGEFIMRPENMGGIFKALHLLLVIFALIFYALYFILGYIWKKNKRMLLAIIISMTLISFLLAKNSCYFWKFGINGKILDQSQLCKVKEPNCAILYFNYLLDISPFLRAKSSRQQIDAYIPNPEKGSFIGFVNSNTYKWGEIVSHQLQKSVFKYATRYKSLNQALSLQKYQVILDNQEQKYHIKVIRNESLAKQRKILFEKAMNSTSPPIAKNVLFLFFDSISRAQAHLKLSKTLEWFKKSSKYQSYLDPQQRTAVNSEQAYQFYRYNVASPVSNQNVLAMYYGLPYVYKRDMPQQQYLNSSEFLLPTDLKQNKHPDEVVFFGKEFQNRGYVTSTVGSYCFISNADFYEFHLRALTPPKFDHQTHSFACDPNFQDPKSRWSVLKGPISSSDHSLYGKKMSEYAFQYALSFFQAYSDIPKLQVINMIEGHDMIGGGSTKHVDQPIRDFLDKLEQKGYAKDTVIVMTSDHGQHVSRYFKSYMVEHYHGLLLVYLPENINSKYRDSIRKNQQNLVSPWNIYYTLKHLAKGDGQPSNMSLMSDLGFQKTCKDAKIPIQPPQLCSCV